MFKRGLAATAVAATALLGLVAPAGAHVTVDPSETPAGSFTKLTFRVPNERPDTGTTRLEVTMPEDVVIPYVSVQPTPGWTAEVTTRTLAEPVEAEGGEVVEVVGTVTWSGGTVNPGEFQDFNISAGPLPDDVESLEFPAIQYYADGEEVRWIEEQVEGGEEPEFPVPVLAITAATGDEHGGSDGDEAAAPVESDDGDDGTDALTIVALVVGGLGVILGGLALIRNRAAS
jgi:periplasmic copper chaperone A